MNSKDNSAAALTFSYIVMEIRLQLCMYFECNQTFAYLAALTAVNSIVES